MIVHIDCIARHLDVDSSYPGTVVCSKGVIVHHLKRYVSWVKYVVRQYGSYLLMDNNYNFGLFRSTKGID